MNQNLFDPQPLYYWMAQTYTANKTPDNRITICNEGGMRSSKTWQTIKLIYTFCDHNRYIREPLQIGFFRNTLKACREKLYEKDFKLCLQSFNAFNHDCLRNEGTSPIYNLFGNRIEFHGLEDSTEQPAFDIVFLNEALEVESELKIAGLKSRCRMLFIADWNPRYTMHWIFDWEKQPFTYFSHTTYKHNKHVPLATVMDLEMKSPWHLDDLKLPEDQRRPHEINIAAKTVDRYYFEVYGMGIRASHGGRVFSNVTYVDKFPESVDLVSQGLDFGKTHQSAFVKCGLQKRPEHGKSNIFLQNIIYSPTETVYDLGKLMDARVAEGLINKKKHINCDNNWPAWTSDLRQMNYAMIPTNKFDGSREYWIDTLKSFNIHIIKDKDFQIEQENFLYRIVDGVVLSETIQEYDHLWSASGYAAVRDFRGM